MSQVGPATVLPGRIIGRRRDRGRCLSIRLEESDWYRTILAEPAVEVVLPGRTLRASGLSPKVETT
jgi:hypothetical protein